MLRNGYASLLLLLSPCLYTLAGDPTQSCPRFSAQVTPDAASFRANVTAADHGELQFRSRGQILGFMPNRRYIVGNGYALVEEFVDAQGVQPFAEQAGTGQRPQLTAVVRRISYTELWKGISVTYTAYANGCTTGILSLNPGAEVSSVKLRYNADVELQADGGLRIRPPASSNDLVLAPPEAWQSTAGRRRRIKVAFKNLGGETIGFTVGTYERTLPLTISSTCKWRSAGGDNNP